MAAQEAALETAAGAALPVLRDDSGFSRKRNGLGTARMAEKSAKAGRWAELGASGYGERAIRFRILDPPSIPFTAGTILTDIPQTEEDLEFGKADLSSAFTSAIYEEISREQAEAMVADGKMILSAFTVWQGDGLELKGIILANLSRQSVLAKRAGKDGKFSVLWAFSVQK
jgi:hypothetical protein